MAKVSLTIMGNRPTAGGEHTVMLQLSSNYKTILVPTDILCTKNNWDKVKRQVKGGKDGDRIAQSKNVRLNQIKNACEVKIINNQERCERMDAKALKKFLLSEAEVVESNFFSYGRKVIEYYKELGRKKTAEVMETTLSKLKDYNVDSSLEFGDISVRYLERFEAWCLRQPIKVHGKKDVESITRTMGVNGVAVYMRNIRTLLNHAIADELTENYPFKKYKIKIEDTLNRNLTSEAVRAIRDYSTEDKREQIARDFFLLQFYLEGINTIDLFWMTPDKIIGNRLQYKRAKTERYKNIIHNVKIEPEAQALINKYRGNKYLLWFADNSLGEREGWQSSPHARRSDFQYKDETAFTKMINAKLNEIQKKLGIKPEAKVTSYYCRHSFASIMRTIDISIDDIQLCLGHKNPDQKVTGIYIDEDWIRADKANRKLLDHLRKEPSQVGEEKKPVNTRKKGLSQSRNEVLQTSISADL